MRCIYIYMTVINNVFPTLTNGWRIRKRKRRAQSVTTRWCANDKRKTLERNKNLVNLKSTSSPLPSDTCVFSCVCIIFRAWEGALFSVKMIARYYLYSPFSANGLNFAFCCDIFWGGEGIVFFFVCLLCSAHPAARLWGSSDAFNLHYMWCECAVVEVNVISLDGKDTAMRTKQNRWCCEQMMPGCVCVLDEPSSQHIKDTSFSTTEDNLTWCLGLWNRAWSSTSKHR